ncbi:MAG TPA: choice-of-anchor D domain-containing protein, partial [Acidobacteriaceae bacterium]
MLTNRFAARLLSAAFSSVLFLLPLNLAQVANAQTAVAIHTIEANPLSYNGQSVTVTGIIVAKRSNGFYLEAKQSNWNSPLTSASEAVFVYSTSTTGAFASSVGTEVSVTGTVTLYSASTPTGPVKETEITAPTVTVVAAGTPASLTTLVPAVTLLPTDTSTTDYASALKYQSMRVKIPSLTTTQGTDGTLSEANETYTSLGTFYGVITGVPRAFREPGIQITVDLPAAAPSPLDIPRWDGNPEVLLVNSIATGGATIDTTANVKLTNLVGVLDYSVGQATFVIDPDTTQARDPLPTMITAQALPARAANEFTVASYNVERFYNSTTAYHGSTQLTAAALALRLNKLSLAIRHILNYPDIIGIQEMSSTSATDPTGTLKLVSDKISADAIAAGETDPHYAYYLVQDTDGTGINTAFLVNTNRVTVNSVTSIGSGVTYINSTGASATLNDRAPLILDATIKAQNGYAAYPVIVISNHLLSLTDIDNQDASAANKRIKRERQAEYLSNIIQGYQATGKHVISVGDHNAFQFSDGYADTLGVIKGTPAANNTVDVGTTSSYVKPTPALVDLVTNLPADQQYSYVFVGNAQVLDHIVVTSDLASAGAHIAYAHMDSEFPAVYRNDATRPEVNSDHDAGLGYFALPADTGGAAITPGSKDFGSITVNTTTAAQTFTFTNSAASSINLTSITASGNFAVTGGTCSTSAPLAAAGTCTITVTFTPTAVGARTGTLTVVSSNVVTSTATASLTGTGTSSAVTITLTPGTADFGSVTQASTSAAQTFTVTNSSSTTLAINSIAASGDFTATAITCSLTTPIAANGSCTISVTFTPTALGARTGTLTVLTGSSTYPTLTASLTGTGAALSITLTPGTANF